ncbi:hypothetical protein SAMN05421594_4093 [Chryseobacterium oleae]|uniref:Uncharacterized protein n=1 Tax=Chryseobacterium oleae TaxID=491207 RepID=A0A1I5BJ31_CHROL|nr:hypothetical protein SAMN05421594_4093 [Chryseobacterium oleae]
MLKLISLLIGYNLAQIFQIKQILFIVTGK